MKIYDISLTLSPQLPVWPGDPAIRIEHVQKMDDGAMCNLTRLDISAHTGTHVDAPFHFVNDGKTIETLDLNVLNGPAELVVIPDTVDEIFPEHFADLPACERVLFKTRNSQRWAENNPVFDEAFVGLHETASKELVARGVRLVGIDALSVAPFNAPEPTHHVLLGAEVIIVEGLNLSGLDAGPGQFHCLPLKINGADGAPARAIFCC